MKLLAGRRHHAEKSDKFVFWMAPLIGLLFAFTEYIVVPLGRAKP